MMSFSYYPEHDQNTDAQSGVFTYVQPGKAQICGEMDNIVVSRNNRALDGDQVRFIVNDSGEAIVTGIRQRSNIRYVGVLRVTDLKIYPKTKRGTPIYQMIPLSWRYPTFLVPSNIKDKTEDVYVVVEFSEWQSSQCMPFGRIVTVIGSVKQPEHQDRALIMKNHLYVKSHVLKSITPRKVEPAVLPDHTDVYVIDPEGATDFDDGFSVDPDQYLIHVHIADPDYYLGDQYDDQIKKRITSIYGDRTYHMLPETIASGVASLNKEGIKRVITVTFSYADDVLAFQTINPSHICVKHQITYEKAQELLGKDLNLQLLARLSGSQDTHKMVEFLMIQTNRAVGKYLCHKGKNFSRYCPVSELCAASTHYPKVNDYIKHRDSPAAQYTTLHYGHANLGLDYYTHFTSPIRRYSDIIAHRLVKQTWDDNSELTSDLEAEAQRINQYNRQVRRYYRDRDILRFYRKLLQHQTYQAEGYIVDFITNKISVYFPEYEIEYQYPLFSNRLIDNGVMNVDRKGSNIIVNNIQTNSQWEIPLYQPLIFNLIPVKQAIRLNQKIIMRLANIEEALYDS